MPDPEEVNELGLQLAAFNAEKHGRDARRAYVDVREDYAELAAEVESFLRRSARQFGLVAYSIESRAKEPHSFERKASEVDPADPTRPKYSKPLEQITDLAGVRVVTFLSATRREFEALISEQLEVLERSDKGSARRELNQFGYQSIHFLASIRTSRSYFDRRPACSEA